MKLVGSNKCPVCGKEFKVEGNCKINPNREFYGGRVKFFQERVCDCFALYNLFIEEKEYGLKVIDMDLIKYGEVKIEIPENEQRENNEAETIVLGEDLKGNPIVTEKKVLVSLPNNNEIREKLELLTKAELIDKLRRRKIKYNKTASKNDLIGLLFDYDPTGMSL